MRELLLFIVALLVHECGHILAALVLGVPVVSFNLCSVGGIFIFDFSRVGYVKEGMVHLSGALLGSITALISCLFWGVKAYLFVGMSIVLAGVNLLPVDSFDGGGVIRCILSQFLFPDTVWKVCRIISFFSVLVLMTAVIWTEMRIGGNIGLMVFVISIMLGQMK